MRAVAYSRFLLILIGLSSLVVASGVRAQDTNPGSASGMQIPTQGTEHIRVVGHLPLENMHVNQMFVQQRGSKYFLFLHRPTKQAYAVVDVTKPEKPALTTRDTLKEAAGTQFADTAPGSAFAIAVTPENSESSADNQAAAAPLHSETVQFVDMSNPKSAKTVKIFKGVTSIYPDDSRKLVYLVNGDGLWIVSHNMTHPLPLCSSESALTPEPDCQ